MPQTKQQKPPIVARHIKCNCLSFSGSDVEYCLLQLYSVYFLNVIRLICIAVVRPFPGKVHFIVLQIPAAAAVKYEHKEGVNENWVCGTT
jgi:hypothetical protein